LQVQLTEDLPQFGFWRKKSEVRGKKVD
jgi:hypothetical protein